MATLLHTKLRSWFAFYFVDILSLTGGPGVVALAGREITHQYNGVVILLSVVMLL
jgi:hypothetical protein